MKRRNFIKGLLGVAAVPVVAKLSAMSSYDYTPRIIAKEALAQYKEPILLTPEEVTREALKMLEHNMEKNIFFKGNKLLR